MTLMVVLPVSSCIEDCLKIDQTIKKKHFKIKHFKMRFNQISITSPDEVLGELFVTRISVVAWNQLELHKRSSILEFSSPFLCNDIFRLHSY